MGKIFCVFGKSASGKDTLYQRLINDAALNLKSVVLYTTRPMREGEVHGETYYFVSIEDYERMKSEGKIIEHRVYDTVFGPWHYFMADDGNVDLENYNYLTIGTLESYCSIRDYFGSSKVIPLYIYVDDGIRLMRSIERESMQSKPAYDEVCRRFLADCSDFSEDKLIFADIVKRFENIEIEDCLAELKSEIIKGCNQRLCL